jgi:hypothetical protein
MAFEIKPNTGSIFRNENKETETSRDYNGSCKINEPGEYWISAWINKPEGKKPYLSLKFELKQMQKRKEGEPPAGKRIAKEEDDDIPFN